MPGRRRYKKPKKVATKVPAPVKNFVEKKLRSLDETKYNDSLFQANVDNVGTISDMFAPTQGTADQNQRVGDKLTLRGSRFSLKMTAGDATNFVRILLIQWYPSTLLTVPTVATVLFDVSSSDRAITSPYVHDYQNMFHVIYDKVFTLGQDDNAETRSKVFKPRFKYVKKTVQFNAGGINGSNKLFMIAISDSGALAHPAVFAYWRTYYDDA